MQSYLKRLMSNLPRLVGSASPLCSLSLEIFWETLVFDNPEKGRTDRACMRPHAKSCKGLPGYLTDLFIVHSREGAVLLLCIQGMQDGVSRIEKARVCGGQLKSVDNDLPAQQMSFLFVTKGSTEIAIHLHEGGTPNLTDSVLILVI